jgi:putative nucleotidyltransferase with HDIG domain
MQAEFREDERRAVLSVDGTAVHTLSSTIISELLASIDKIPPFPVIANRLIEALESKEVRTDVIERLVTQDAVIAAKILSVANSPVYGLSTPVETLPLAMRTLGLEEISRIAVAAAAAAVFDVGERLAHDSVSQQQQAVWSHSLATARGAAWLAMQRNADVQRAYVAGLIHDVGKAVALRGLGMALINGRLSERPPSALVYATIEQAHVEVGNIVADAWHLGDYLAAVVSQHHDFNTSDELTRIVMLTSMVDELRTNPAQARDLLAQIHALSGVMSMSSTQMAELEFEVKKASSSAKL